MFDVASFQEFLNPFGWFLALGKGDTDQIKGEIEDLLQHSSQSLKSLLELSDVLEEIPLAQFSEQRFSKIANHCDWFFTSPDAAQKARTHCADIRRDVARINFKMSKVLRTEALNWRGINDAFKELMDADRSFLEQYEAELKRIGGEIDAVRDLLRDGKAEAASRKYEALRASLLGSKRLLTNEIARMQEAQTHVHELLT